MRILISGSSGLIGSAVVERLKTAGHEIVRLVRSESLSGANSIYWQPEEGRLDAKALEGADAVIHLAGENVARRWTPAQKLRIRESRIQNTRLLSEKILACKNPPKAFLCASAIGYFGDRGAEALDEDSPPGKGFLAEVCREWEEAAGRAGQAGVRVVPMRIGMVLSPKGGALAKMLPIFRAGMGGPSGKGTQYVSWIALDDATEAIAHILAEESLRGPVNLTTPQPVSNREFAQTLGRILKRPAILPAPAFALRLAFGEMADTLLLSSLRIVPKRLLESGFRFCHPDLEEALKSVL